MKNKAFTIIELLVASALSVLLMVGVLRVVGSFKLESQKTDATQSLKSDALIKLFIWDMLNAQTISQKDNTIVLTGHGSLERQTPSDRTHRPKSATHQPVKIEYELRKTQSESWLVRRQTHLNDMTNHNAWTEVVSRGVNRFELKPTQPHLITTGDPKKWLHKPSPVPHSVRIVVEPNDPSEQILDRWVVLR